MNLTKTNYKEIEQEFPSCSSVEECQAFLAKASKDYLEGNIEYGEYKKAKSKYGANYSKTILESTTVLAYFSLWLNSLTQFFLKRFKPSEAKSTEPE